MSVDGSCELVFAGDVRRFRLAIDNLIALQDKLNSGPMEIVQRLQTGRWRIEDVTETLRIGLIGGGAGTADEAKAARALVDSAVKPGDIVQHVLTALVVILSALQGDIREDAQKKSARRRTRKRKLDFQQQNTTAAAQ